MGKRYIGTSANGMVERWSKRYGGAITRQGDVEDETMNVPDQGHRDTLNLKENLTVLPRNRAAQ